MTNTDTPSTHVRLVWATSELEALDNQLADIKARHEVAAQAVRDLADELAEQGSIGDINLTHIWASRVKEGDLVWRPEGSMNGTTYRVGTGPRSHGPMMLVDPKTGEFPEPADPAGQTRRFVVIEEDE